MTGAQPGAVVAVEVLVEQDMIAPVRIVLERRRAAVDRPVTIRVAQEDPFEAAGDLLRHLEQVHHVARTGRALHLEVVAVVQRRSSAAPDDQMALTGIQIGPRQLEFPPNMPLSDSAGR